MTSLVDQQLNDLKQEWSRRHNRPRARLFLKGYVSERDLALLNEILEAMDRIDERSPPAA